MKQNKKRSPLKLILIFCFLSVLIIIISSWLFILQKEEIIKQKHEELSVIADMKVNDIVLWREEIIIDISGKSDSKIFPEAVGKWFKNLNNEGLKNIIISDLNSFVKYDRYQEIIIFDSKGNIQLTLLDTLEKLSENAFLDFQQTIKSKEPVFGDFYTCNICGKVHLDIIAPLIVDGKVIGGLLLRIDRDNFLNPLIKSWPTPSKSSESFLVRKEGNEVVFLNELRRYENSTLKLKFTISDENSIIPAVMAAKGIEGMVEGIDYSGVPVIADIKKVPETNWFKISKVDIKEVYAPIKEKALYTILFAGVLILSVGIGFYQIWKSEEKTIRLQQAEAELRHQAMLKHFEYLVKYANDLIILSDINLDIVEVNNSAEIAYGYTRDEMLKMNIKDILSPEAYLFNDEIKKSGDSEKGILFETIHKRKDGTTFNVEVSIRKIEYKGKKYFQRIIRDITERKLSEKKIVESEAKLKEAQNIAKIGNWDVNVITNEIFWSEEMYNITGRDKSLPPPNIDEYSVLYTTDHFNDFKAKYIETLNTGESYTVEREIIRFDNKKHCWIYFNCNVEKDKNSKVIRFFGTAQDITEMKEAGEKLISLNKEILDLYNNAPCGYHSLNSEGYITRINDTELKWLGYEKDEVINRKHFTDILTSSSIEIFNEKFPVFQEKGFINNLEFELKRKDGTAFFVNLNATAVYDENGKYKYSRSSIFDITKRKIAEEKLHQADINWKGTFNAINDQICLLDIEGNIIQCNESMSKSIGKSEEIIRGRKCYELMHNSGGFKHDCPYTKMMRSKKREINELEMGGKHLAVSVDPIFSGNNEILGAVHIIRDITERKVAEKQMRELARHLQSIREDERTKLSRTLHDNFGQSLTGLKMEISSIEKKLSKYFDSTDNPEISGKIKSMKTTIDELALLTSTISMELRPNVLDMLGLKPAIEWLAEDFKNKSEIDCKLTTDLENINLNPLTSTEVFRIVQESLTNVIRHANATLVNINVFIKNNNYAIEVEDNGRGIKQSEISSPYSMGILGMKERAVLFGGEINFSDGEGKGTKVSIIIPITKI